MVPLERCCQVVGRRCTRSFSQVHPYAAQTPYARDKLYQHSFISSPVLLPKTGERLWSWTDKNQRPFISSAPLVACPRDFYWYIHFWTFELHAYTLISALTNSLHCNFCSPSPLCCSHPSGKISSSTYSVSFLSLVNSMAVFLWPSFPLPATWILWRRGASRHLSNNICHAYGTYLYFSDLLQFSFLSFMQRWFAVLFMPFCFWTFLEM